MTNLELETNIADIDEFTEENYDPMVWAQQLYTKEQVNKAGKALASGNLESVATHIWALEVLNNWRAIHGYPLNNFQNRLRVCAQGVCPDVLVAQRIKRVTSIIRKLNEIKGMVVGRMQDIAGCRAIVQDTNQIYKLYNDFYYFDKETNSGGYGAHKQIGVDDYIETPKVRDGYRSLHLKYEYQSKKNSIHNGLKVEIQLRTRLQHAWATAVETVQTFTGETIKGGRIKNDWGSFFRLVSSAFALMELTNPVDVNKDHNVDYLRQEIKNYMDKLRVENVLHTYGETIRITVGDNSISPVAYWLLSLYPKTGELAIVGFEKGEFNSAMKTLVDEERNIDTNTVLVGANSLKDLRKSYPNYYLDTTYFMESIKNFL